MNNSNQTDYSALDHPEVCSRIFHPRPEITRKPPEKQTGEKHAGGIQTTDHLIPVEENVQIGARFHMGSPNGANILFFHGNGEIVADYDDLGPHFNQLGINLLVVDYRGYGRSNGQPTVTTMMNDCHVLFDHTSEWLKNNGYNGPLIVMGRSLGSASAYELASTYSARISGLIIESGFAFTEPLLQLLGINTQTIGFEEATSFGNLFKAAAYQGPTLFIHAEQDEIIPCSDGKALYDVSPAENKQIVIIANANHNDILLRGWEEYFQAIQRLAADIQKAYG